MYNYTDVLRKKALPGGCSLPNATNTPTHAKGLIICLKLIVVHLPNWSGALSESNMECHTQALRSKSIYPIWQKETSKLISLLSTSDQEHYFWLHFSVNEFLSSLELGCVFSDRWVFMCPKYLISTALHVCSLSLQWKDSTCLFLTVSPALRSVSEHSICSINICWMNKVVSLLFSLLYNLQYIIFKIQLSIRNGILSILRNNFENFTLSETYHSCMLKSWVLY